MAADRTVNRALKLVKSKWRRLAERYNKWVIEGNENIVEWAEEEEQTVEFVVKEVIREAEERGPEAAVQELDEMLEKLRSGETYYKERIPGYRRHRGHEDVDLEAEVVVESIYEALLEEYLLRIEQRDEELVEMGRDFIERQSSYWRGATTEMARKNASSKPYIAASHTADDLRDEARAYEQIKNSLRFIEYLESHEEDRYNLDMPEDELRAAEKAVELCEEREQELGEIIELLGEAREVGMIARKMVNSAGNPGLLKKLDKAFMTGRSLRQVSAQYDRKIRVEEEFIEDILQNLEEQGVEVQDVRDAIEEKGVEDLDVINLLASKKLEIAEQRFAELQDHIEQEEKEFVQQVEKEIDPEQ